MPSGATVLSACPKPTVTERPTGGNDVEFTNEAARDFISKL